jgi:hypothetical protein
MIGLFVLFTYVACGLGVYIWAFVGSEYRRQQTIFKRFEIMIMLIVAWPFLVWTAFARAAKKRDKRKDD